MVRHPLRRKKHTLLIWGAVACFVGLRFYYDALLTGVTKSRDLVLREGRYEILEIVDPITFVCQPIEPPENSETSDQRIEIRLAGVSVANCGDFRIDESLRIDGIQESLRFLQNREVWLRFDKHRFDEKDTVLAYLYVDGEMLNHRLSRLGLCRVEPIPGNSNSIQRQLRKATQLAQRKKLGVFAYR